MPLAFDVNKMNIWHVYTYIWCPIAKRLVTNLKNEDQVHSLGAILASVGGNVTLQCLQYIQYTNGPFSYVPCTKQHLSLSESSGSSARLPSLAVPSPPLLSWWKFVLHNSLYLHQPNVCP